MRAWRHVVEPEITHWNVLYLIAPSYLPSLVIAAGSLVGASLVLLPLLPLTMPRTLPSPQSIAAVIALALLSTALAYLLYFRLIAYLGSTRALTVGYLIPLFAMGWGVLWLGESVTAAMGLGGGLVLLGTAIANRPTKLPSVSPKPSA
ncbi:EamA family transporter [Nodosilinea sp. LEGE 07088]|uniref:EamA family transporter n=1 Tax=Nodosilinea sp. LEGE 07088 TaxID=2777968 RepID=UPI00188039D8|nr:EamA family transporter [Nodosilinea sp. LEGE 07088]MBE9140314.1 EamA family transporter [Nodosilinea sp. LEGE 07088]